MMHRALLASSLLLASLCVALAACSDAAESGGGGEGPSGSDAATSTDGGATPGADGSTCDGGPCVPAACDAGDPACTQPQRPAPTLLALGGDFSCAVRPGGAVKCWGDGLAGRLGHGTTDDSFVPVAVKDLPAAAVEITAGDGFACARLADGHVRCWGMNDHGQLGRAGVAYAALPAEVSGLGADAVQVSAGMYHACAVTKAGGVKCWGANDDGALGVGDKMQRDAATAVVGLDRGVVQVEAGQWFTCALTALGGVKCWGWGTRGALGTGNDTTSTVPVDVVGLSSGVARLAAGTDHMCAVMTAGGMKCWGSNASSALGGAASELEASFVPVDVKVVSDPVAWASGGNAFTCVVTASGSARCWGKGDRGQLGDATTNGSAAAITPTGLTAGYDEVASGREHSCARDAAGKVMCWGQNLFGQIGNGEETDMVVPVPPTAVKGL